MGGLLGIIRVPIPGHMVSPNSGWMECNEEYPNPPRIFHTRDTNRLEDEGLFVFTARATSGDDSDLTARVRKAGQATP